MTATDLAALSLADVLVAAAVLPILLIYSGCRFSRV